MGRYLKVVPGRGINTSQAFDEVYLVNDDGTPWEPDAASGPDILAVGDSMTAQGYPAYLALASGRTVHNAGVGGEPSQGIAARTGALPYLLLPAGGAIPASGPVTVTISEPAATWPLLQGDGIPGDVMRGTLAGVTGVLSLTQPSGPSYSHLADDVYTFTRDVAGSAVPVTRPAPFRTLFSEAHRKDILAVWAGRNNWSTMSRVLADVRAMTRHLTAAMARFVVLGVTNGRLEPTGSAAYNGILALNAALAEEYGRRFIDVRAYLLAYGLADAGITPTTGDLADIAAGIIPNSLRTDSVHLTEAGKVVVANLVSSRLLELGFTTIHTPVAYPAAPAAYVNLVPNGELETNLTGWDGGGGAVVSRVTTQAFAGLASLQAVHAAATTSSARYGSGGAASRIPVAAGSFQSKARVKAPLGHEFRLIVHHYDATNYLGNTQGFATGTGDWQVITAAGALTAGTTGLVVEVNKTGVNAANTDTIYVDGLEVWQ